MLTPADQERLTLTADAWGEYTAQLAGVFPPELLERRCFLRWRALPNRANPQKLDKVPEPVYSDAAGYLTFDEAQRFFKNRGYAGLGVANLGLDFTIIDCDEPVLKGPLPTWTDSCRYWELSPSGKGWRGFFSGRLPELGSGARTVDGVEVYRDKWATVTGRCIATRCPKLSPLPAELVERWNQVQPRVQVSPEGETGWWSREALEALLSRWRDCIEDFQFHPTARKSGFRVPCPGNPPSSWSDGNCHSQVSAALSDDTIVYVENGWAVFNCLHAHCSLKTWPALCTHYDPSRDFFNVDEWLEERLLAAQETW